MHDTGITSHAQLHPRTAEVKTRGWVKKQLAMYLCMAERVFWLLIVRLELEWPGSLQIIEYQLVARRPLQFFMAGA